MKRVREKTGAGLSIPHSIAREALAEFFGTAILIAMGDGSVAQSVLSKGANGGFLSINIGWGIAVMLGVHLCGGVSGGHLNPAMSIFNFFLGNIGFVQLLVYSLAQYARASLGSAVVYGIYYDALEAYDGGQRQVCGPTKTAGIWATYPAPYLTAGNGLADQIFGTCILAVAVLSICDPRNMSVPKGMIPVLVGLTIMGIGISYGFNCGYAINPARDLAPRLFTAAAGWGWETFTYETVDGIPWWWVPVVGPYLGATLGALIYYLSVGIHWPPLTTTDRPPAEPKTDRSKSKELNAEKPASIETNETNEPDEYDEEAPEQFKSSPDEA